MSTGAGAGKGTAKARKAVSMKKTVMFYDGKNSKNYYVTFNCKSSKDFYSKYDEFTANMSKFEKQHKNDPHNSKYEI